MHHLPTNHPTSFNPTSFPFISRLSCLSPSLRLTHSLSQSKYLISFLRRSPSPPTISLSATPLLLPFSSAESSPNSRALRRIPLAMPPRKFFTPANKGKGQASSSSPTIRTRRLATHPWPRPENTPFDLGTDELPPSSPDSWDTRDAYYYNQLLGLKLEPTRYMCETTLQQLGLQDQVRQILGHAHCMSFALEEDILYPDLVRQCLATATITYKDPHFPTLNEGTFSFFAGGTKYDISMWDFCVVYGFRETVTNLDFPKKFSQSKDFWSHIASGQYSSNSASQNRLRHPALRICARIFSNMLFARAVGNKVHIDELLLLFLGCGNIVGDGNAEQYEVYRSNLGVRFAEVICGIKDSPTETNKGPRVERIGSLLTPLFRHHRVDLSDASCVTKLSRMDMKHLLASKIIIQQNTYQFISATGEANYIELPNPIVTELYTMDDLAFRPPPQYLVPNPSRASSARPSTSRHISEDDATPVPRLALPYHTSSTAGEFDLPPISDDADTTEYRRWMIESTKKNNSLMQRIMQTLARGCCHTTAAAAASPRPSNSTSGTGQPLRRRKRRAPASPGRSREDDDDTATTR